TAVEQRLAGFELHGIPAIAASCVLCEVLQLRRGHSNAGPQASVAEVTDQRQDAFVPEQLVGADMCGIAGRCITGANSRLLRFAATGHEILGKGDLLRGQVGARRGKRVHWAGNSWAEVTVIRAASRGLWNRFQRTDERGSRVYSPGGGRSKSRRAHG